MNAEQFVAALRAIAERDYPSLEVDWAALLTSQPLQLEEVFAGLRSLGRRAEIAI